MRTAFINGKVWLNQNFAQAFIVEDDKFVAVGTNQAILAEPHERVYDLQNKVVLPGLIDTHIHFFYAAKYYSYLDLSKVKSHDEMIEAIQKYQHANNIQADDVIIGYDWIEDQFVEKQAFDRHLLDQYFPNVAVFLWRQSYHSAIVNTLALKRLGLFYPNAQYESSIIECGDDGMPTGYMREQVCFRVDELLSHNSHLREKKALIHWAKEANRLGILGINTCDLRNKFWYKDYLIYEQANNENQLNFEIYHQMWLTETDSLDDFLVKLPNLKPQKNNHVFHSIKVFADGVLNNQTINVKNHKELNKFWFIDKDNFVEFVKKINQNQLSVVAHSIGNETTHFVAHSYVLADASRKYRNGIIHANLMDQELILLCQKHQTPLSIQPVFLSFDRSDDYRDIYLPLKTMFDLGLQVSFGTDWKVCDLNPWQNMWWALNHPNQQQSITLEQALDAYTAKAAYYLGAEDKLGKIATNYYANFIVLEQDIFQQPYEQIGNTKVAYAYFRGKLVYSKDTV